MPIPLILWGAGSGLAYLATKKKAAVAPTSSRGKTQVVTPTKQTSKNPASASAPRADRGATANQPWYTGPENAAAGAATTVAMSAALSGLSGMFQSGNGDTENDGPDVSEDDVSETWNGIPDNANSDTESYEFSEDPSADNTNTDSSGDEDYSDE